MCAKQRQAELKQFERKSDPISLDTVWGGSAAPQAGAFMVLSCLGEFFITQRLAPSPAAELSFGSGLALPAILCYSEKCN